MAPGRRRLLVAADWLLRGGNARCEEMRRINQRGKRYDLGLRWFTPIAARHTQPPVGHLGCGASFANVMCLNPSLRIGSALIAGSYARARRRPSGRSPLSSREERLHRGATALTDGFSATLLGAAGIAAVGAVLSALLLKKPATPAGEERESGLVAA